MPTIHDQLAWEERMIQHGVERFRAQQDKAVAGDRAHETSAGATLLRSYVLQISDHIQLYLAGKHPDGRRRNKYARLLETLNADKAAMFCLKNIIGTLYQPKALQSVAINVGSCVEDDIRFTKFQVEHKEYYDEIIRSWETKGTKSYTHKRNVLATKSGHLGMQWDAWDRDTLFGVGSLVISLLMEVCDLVEIKHVHHKGGRQEAFIVPTDECIQWVMHNNEMNEVGSPDLMPCLVPPADWTTPVDGGFFSAPLRSRIRLVKTKWRTRPEVAEAEMPAVLTAINAMQQTGWRVNRRVYEVMREVWHKNLQIGMPRSDPYEIPPCPLPEEVKAAELGENDPRRAAFEDWKATARELHTMEKERISMNLAVARTVRIAADMHDYPAFWYVYQCDFRGRVYCTTTGLSPPAPSGPLSSVRESMAMSGPLGRAQDEQDSAGQQRRAPRARRRPHALSDQDGRHPCRSPRRCCTTARPAKTAVSARSTRAPSTTARPVRSSAARSASDHPPSGPTASTTSRAPVRLR